MADKEEGDNHFDLIVIGGGTAGLRTALYAASHEHKTALIDPGALGGTCLNTGCIPTKAMLHASGMVTKIKNAKQLGINSQKIDVDFKVLMQRVRNIINEGQEHISVSIQNKNLTIIKSKAAFVEKDSVQTGGQTLTAEKFIICTGASPRIPPLKGIENVDYLLSDDVISLEKLPSSIVVIGGGYIAMELATFFNDLGCKVIIIERNPLILKDLDEDIIASVRKYYEEEGIVIKTNAEVLEVSEERNMKKVIYTIFDQQDKQTATAEELLVATGRSPHTFGLNLEAANVKQGEKGEILVNNQLQTSNSHIYAIGDVIGKTPFAHAAKRESHIALVNALENKKETMDFELVPWAIFTEPPIGNVGINERQAKEKKLKYGILRASYSRAGRATVMNDTRGFVKVIYDRKTNKILGACIIGPRADDLIHEFVALMNVKGTVEDLRNIIHIHPTLSEVFEALKEIE